MTAHHTTDLYLLPII